MNPNSADLPNTFGGLLKYLRRRVALTQRGLGIAVGYSDSQINKLEKGHRAPDIKLVSSAFVKALKLTHEPVLAARLIELATATREAFFSTFPQTFASVTHNLPTLITSFVGRTQDIQTLEALLAVERLLTLLGPGGCGKTRLAVELANRRRTAYADGAWLVELASVADPAAVAHAVGDALKIVEIAAHGMKNTLAIALRERHMLLILDNCEHVATACAQLVDALLKACPRLTVLATSREPLRVPGEARWQVLPLALPTPEDRSLPPKALAEFAAVKLFIDRAQAARRSAPLRLSADLVRAIVDICHRLDGMPLAIELAAARAGSISINEILARLDDRFRLLVGGGPALSARQQSLRAAIEWSIALLTPKEHELLTRLSMFVGGWTLEAAEAVCADATTNADNDSDSNGNADALLPADVLDVLSALVEKSLVQILDEGDGYEAMRYGMLESIREYARPSGSAFQSIARRQAEWCLGMIEGIELMLFGREQMLWLHSLNRELGNIRAALTYFIEARDAEGARRLAGSLRRFWQTRGRASEGRQWLMRAITLDTEASIVADTKAYFTAAVLANYQGDEASRDPLLARAIDDAQKTNDPWLIGQVLAGIIPLPRTEEEYQFYKLRLAAVLANARELGNDWLLGNGLHKLATLELDHGQIALAQHLFRESNSYLERVGDVIYSMVTLMWLGNIALKLGDMKDAEGNYSAALELVVQSGIEYAEHIGVWHCLRGMAELAVHGREPLRMARLLGAIQLEEEAQGGMNTAWFPALDAQAGAAHYTAITAEAIDPATYEDAWHAGRTLTLEDAIGVALRRDGG